MKLRFLKLLIIPFLLTFGYLMLISYPYFNSKINRYDSLGPLSLVEEKSVDIQRTFSSQHGTDQFDKYLLKGEKASSKLRASENNFGILLFRFAQLSAKVSDVVTFRIKKEGESKWYYEHNYKANQFQPDQYFTFGFPPITNSKNKAYVFEIESLSGTYKNGTGVSLKEPQVALVYKYSRGDLTNINTFFSFISKKLIYVVRNVNFLQNWQLLAAFVLPLLLILFKEKVKIMVTDAVRFLPKLKKSQVRIIKVMIRGIKSNYLRLQKKMISFSKRISYRFTSNKVYLVLLNTDTKKRLAIGLFIFLLAFTYRFSALLVSPNEVFYSGLGGQGDYDQLIRVAGCSLNLCSGIIIANFLFLTPLLGAFYAIFGFIGGIKAFLYLMMIIGSIVTVLPYLLLTLRKNWFSVGGIIGSLFLATNDFLTSIALGFPIDNSSLFTFSIFTIVYFLTLQKGTIYWFLLLGLVSVFDGLNKVLFLMNNLVAISLFVPLFFFEKAKRVKKFLFSGHNLKILLKAFIPLLIFLLIYVGWEYITYTKFFNSRYFLWSLFFAKNEQVSYYATKDIVLAKGLFSQFIFLNVSAMVMIKRLIESSNFSIFFLAAIYSCMILLIDLRKISIKKNIFIVFSIFLALMLVLIKNNYNAIHVTFAGEYIASAWNSTTYISIFLFFGIMVLSILEFKYSAIKYSAPIFFYVIMLILMAKNAPFARLHTHVVAWSVIMLAYIIDWIITNVNKHSTIKMRIMLGSVFLILFICTYMLPKTVNMVIRLNSGLVARQNDVRYLKWVEKELPGNAIILAGGKSDLVIVAENIKRPIAYNVLWNAALLIRPNEIPRFASDRFNIINELKNKKNFSKKKHIILEDDISVWRERMIGVKDSVFSASPNTPHADDYFIEVYKFNSALKKGIYELKMKKIKNLQ